VIGRKLPVKKIASGMKKLVDGLHPNGFRAAAEAIMTTDKFKFNAAIKKRRIENKEAFCKNGIQKIP
jgi:N-acetylglutamate synthase/N-acetylornithine aminotransferase